MPLFLWLQGGPGHSGLLGNFFELDPYFVNPTARPSHATPSHGTTASVSSSLTTRSAPSLADIPTNQLVLTTLQSFYALDLALRA